MTYGSLFTGIGGLDLGLDRAGWHCRWQVEIDPYATKVLEKHWPHVERYGDITKLSGEELEPVDLLCGGFPCQDLSQAGKQAGIEGTRSGLWFEFARIIGVVRPRYVLVENVPGILVPGAMRRVVGILARLGYVGTWRSLRASEFGASHLRKRVFIVAYAAHQLHNGTGIAGQGRRGQPANGHRTLEDAIRPEQYEGFRRGGERMRRGVCETVQPLEAFAPGPSSPLWPYILRERPDLAPALAHTGHAKRKAGGSGEDSCAGKADGGYIAGDGSRGEPAPPDEPGAAPPQSQICRVVDGLSSDLDRAMKDRTKRLGRLGNAVVPQVAEWIGHRIMEFEEVYA